MTERTGHFRRSERLLRSREFQHVARHGRRAVVRGFVVLLAPRAAAGTPGGPRLGITVSRRVGGAVVRNQLKRRIREWFRAAARTLPGSVDLVVIGRRAAATLSGAEVRQQLECATAQLAGNGR